jgi:thermolysin
VYDYYFKRFSRHGMDDREIEVDSIVHPLSRSEANGSRRMSSTRISTTPFIAATACWYSATATVAPGIFLPAAFDVVAHEWTHGVTDFTSQLDLPRRAGRLNEAFSDIMGASIEFYYQPAGSGRDQADWLIAEDVYLAAPGYLRSLSEPGIPKGTPTTTAFAAIWGRIPTMAACTST